MIGIKKIHKFIWLILVVVASILACDQGAEVVLNQSQISTKIELGRHLFFDKKISYNSRTSCATCHDPALAFTDSYRVAFNHKAKPLKTNTSSLLNLSNYPYFSWQDTGVLDLNIQMKRPFFSMNPVELGVHLDSMAIFQAIQKSYGRIWMKFYSEISSENMIDAIARYVQTLEHREALVDDYLKGVNCGQIDADFEHGWNLFFELECHHCHGGVDFNFPELSRNYPLNEYRISGLRNVRITAPYFHDGSIHDLEKAIRFHLNTLDKYEHLDKELDPADMNKILHFLDGLSDISYLSKEHFRSPFNQ